MKALQLENELDAEAARQLRRALDAPAKVDRVSELRAARKAGIKSIWRELYRTYRQPGRLTSDEYFYYQLYNPAFSAEKRQLFVGKNVQTAMHNACNDARWFAAADDKLLFYSIMRGAGMAVPETLALYDLKGRNAFCRTLRDRQALHQFLSDPSNYPLFLKPVDGMYSLGVLWLQHVSEAGITLKSGRVTPVDSVIDFMGDYGRQGYLLQRVLRPHPVLARDFADTLPAVRLLVLLTDDGPVIESAVIKIPCTRNTADNYWRPGNMLGAVDLQTGRIERIVTGTGANLTEIASHPDTEVPLTGYTLPDWSQAASTCLTAASMLPGIRTQSWDVALSENGPVLMEVNFGGDLNLHQLAHRRGILSPRYVAHLAACGYRGALPASPSAR